MKKQSCLAALVAVAGLMVLGCQKSPNPVEAPLAEQGGVNSLAKASTFTSNVSLPIDLIFFVPCAAGGAGEEVHVTGQIHELFHVTLDGRGGFHLELHQNARGVRGTGLTTGDKYQVTGMFHTSNNGKVGYEETLANNLHFIGKGSGSNFLLHQTFHITVNANGAVTAFVDNSRVECK
jgi:hypothetical protein